MTGLQAAGRDTRLLASVRPDGFDLDRTLSRAVAPYRDTALSVLDVDGRRVQEWLGFFPNATVHTFARVDTPHVRVLAHAGDPGTPSALHRAAFYGAPFDVIVSGGRLVTLLYLWEALRVGGVYVVEAPGRELGAVLGSGGDWAVLHKG